MDHDSGKARLAYLMLAIAAVAWGGNFVVGRAVHAEIPPIGLAFWRWTTAAAILLPFTLGEILRHHRVIRANLSALLTTAFFGIALFHSLVYVSLNTTTAINGALVLALIPATIPVFARLILGERFSARQAVGVAISTLGVTVLVARGKLAVILDLDFVAGDLLLLFGVLCWSLYSVLVKRLPAELGQNATLTVLMIMGSAMLLPFYVGETLLMRPMPLAVQTLWTVAYVAIFASVAAMFCFNRGVAMVGPSRAGPFQHLIPVSAAVFAVAFLGERLEAYHLIGFAVIVAGLYLATTRPDRRADDVS